MYSIFIFYFFNFFQMHYDFGHAQNEVRLTLTTDDVIM
jgi:hypothetical protein